MMQYEMVQATRIAQAVVDNVETLVDKLCEGEPESVRPLVKVLLHRMQISEACACFLLPPLDEV